jgi:hypothetical protein
LNSRMRRKVEVADDVPVGNAWSTGTESCHEGVGGNATFKVDSDFDVPKFRAELSQDALNSGLSQVSSSHTSQSQDLPVHRSSLS